MLRRGLHTLPRRALRYPASQIRWKIIAPYALLVVLLAFAGSYLFTRVLGESLDERFNNQLVESGRVVSDSIVRRERQHLEVLRSVAFTDGVAGAVAARDPWRIASLVQPIAANTGAARIEVLDASGRRLYGLELTDDLARTYAQLDDGDDTSAWPLVADLVGGRVDERGDKFTSIIEAADGHVLYTGGPVYRSDEPVGYVLVGTPLPAVLAAAKADASADVTLFAGSGAVLATTFPPDDASSLDLAPAADRPSGAAHRESKTLYGRDFELLYAPLNIRGEATGAYAVALPSGFIFNAQSTTRLQMALFFGVATGAVMLVGWIISHNLTSPLDRLVGATRAMSGGDLSARAALRRLDEIGVLGHAFDSMAERLQRQHVGTVRALTSAIDARDPYTLGHSLRVGQLAVELGRELGLPQSQLQHLEIGGYLHDIGKIGVRDAVLLKPAALSPHEREAIERHPLIGIEILEHVDLAPEVLEFVVGHHEKLDGSGYPRHLHSDELSMIARIAAVADMYDALVTDRPYRAGLDPAEVVAMLHRQAAHGQLDVHVVRALERIVPRWELRRRQDPQLRGFRLERTEAA